MNTWLEIVPGDFCNVKLIYEQPVQNENSKLQSKTIPLMHTYILGLSGLNLFFFIKTIHEVNYFVIIRMKELILENKNEVRNILKRNENNNGMKNSAQIDHKIVQLKKH